MTGFKSLQPSRSVRTGAMRRSRSVELAPEADAAPMLSSIGFPRATPIHVRATAGAAERLDLAAVPTRPLEYAWRMYLGRAPNEEMQALASDIANDRQAEKWGDRKLTLTQKTAIEQYMFNSNDYVNDYLRHGQNEPMTSDTFPEGAEISVRSAARRARQLTEILERTVPENGPVMLFRGGYGHRSTSGEHFRRGVIRPGDILVNGDFISFTENPYTVAKFCKSWYDPTDETSVVFQLSTHHSPKPIAPFSVYAGNFEDESLCPPLRWFRVLAIDTIEPVIDDQANPLVIVSIEEIPATGREGQAGATIRAVPSPSRFFDFRTGEPFDFDKAQQRLGAD